MKRTAKWGTFLAILAVLSGTLIIRGTITQVPAGTWAPAGNSTSMASARAGAASVLLQDGRILITGGDPGTGAVSSADLFDISGNFSAAAPMIYPRSQHTATVLADGTVLVTGGQSGVTGGTALATAEIYNPTANTWTPTTGTMVVARSGHTASLLQDSTVLVAGGDNQGTAQSSLEIYNASTGLFSTTVGSLTSPRELHAAAVLQSGQVIIVGGQCAGSAQNCPAGTGALASSDTYDPSSGSVSAGPAMSTPRQNLSATTQLDGKVLVAGGNNGNANGNVDLATAEVYDPTAGTFTLTSSLATARQGHQAFLLPHNAAILVVGGTSTVGGVETASSSVEMYYPLASGTDAPANWNGTFNPTAAMDSFTGGSARTGATGASPSNGTPSSIDDGLLLVAGGKDATGTALSSSELYGFAWVKTDATDYAPGTTVNITGGGWQPGETITLHFQEVPYYDSHPDLTATVQSDGTFSNSQFSPDSHDIGIRFYLYVTGSKSGLQAQTTFTDNNVTVLSAPSGVTYTLTWTGYKTSSNCTGTIQNGPTNVLGITSSNGPGKNLGIGTPTSLELQAPPLSDQGGAFQNWSWTQTAAVTAVGSSTALTSPTSTHPICAQNPTGTFTATYSATATAPTLSNISVASGDLGTTVASMVLTGTNFVAGSTVSFSGTGITIGTTTVNSSTQITLTNVAISGTASSVGSHNVTVTNPGSGGGSATSGTQTFTVNPRTTSTSVSCSPASVNVGSATTCTATVTDTDSGTKTAPTGTVTLASSGSGSGSGTFSPSSGQCTLSGSTSPTSCSVSYTPSAVGTGTHTITGSYSGDGTHASSNDTETGFSLAVNKATATVTLSNLTQTYTGSALTPTATTSPSGLSITWTGAPDTAAGSYAVTATVNDANYTGSASGTFTINKAAATVTLSNLTQTYAGSALTPTATTSPSGLSITWTGAPDTNAGSYPVTATVNDANYTGSASGTFTINKAAATVTLSNLTQTYTGSALTPTATTSPSGLSITWTGAPDTNAGSYPVTATVNDANYTGSASGTFTINKAAATVTLSNLTQTYTGSALTPTATTSPSGLSITWTGAPDTNAGSYPVTATVNDANYTGSASGTFTINKAAATVTLSNLTQTYTGGALTPTATTSPAGPSITWTGAPDTNIGSYAVTATVNDANYTGSASGTFTINKAAATVTLSNLTQTYTGSALTPTATTSPSGLSITWTGAPDTAAGSYPVTATVNDPNYTGSASGTFTINKASSTTGISASPSSITIGQSTTVTATVNPQHSGTPGGTVSVSDGFTGIGDTCTITLSGGTGTCNLTPTAIGSLTVTGTYNGDSNFAGSSGSAGLSVTGTPAYITSANNTTFTAGAPGSFTVTTSGIPTPAITETGTLPAGVTFTDNGNGTATLATTAAATLAGTFTITINAANIVGADSQSFTLTISPGAFTQLQVLVPGETAVPGDVTDGGKTGRPSTGYVNGQFQVTVNAVDQYWNVVNTVTDTVHFTSTDTNPATQLPADTPLVAGTGKFSVTLETPENPAATTITATDETTTGITDGTSAKLEVIVVYTATISPTMAGTGDAATYMLTVNNFASPNTNNLGSVTVKVPQDGGTPSNVSVTAANGNTQVNWFVDSNPPNQYASGYIAVRECTASDASAPCNGTGSNDVTAGGTISIHFTATATNSISGATAQNIWTTTAYSDAAYASGLPLAPPEPTVTIGQPPAFTSGASTTFTYGAAGTFSVQATGYPTPSLTESGSLPSGVTFTDNKDGTATLAGTPTSAGAFPITITAHNGYGTDATQNFTLTVNKASATITVTPYNVTYDGKAHSATVTSITGVNGETGATVGTVDVSNTTHTNAGTYSSDYWSFTGTANYNNIAATTITDTINKATASISVTPYSVTYDGSAHTATGTATGVGGVNLASDLDLSHTTHTNAGTYSTDYWTFTDNTGNYNNVAATTITDCIKKANATVVVTPYTVTYDGNAHIATVTSITGVNGETGATVGTVTLNTTHTNAGTYASDTWSFTGTANYNNIAATMITDTINKADAKVVVAPYTVAYDGNAHTATVTSITGVNGEMGATVGTVTLNTTHTAAGTYNTDSWSFTGAANYNDIAATTITDTINKANAVVVVKPYTVNYDGQPHTATVTSITGVNGETGATVGTVDVSNTTHTNAGTYASDSWSFTGAANYNNIAATTITDQINQATLKITAASGMMTYGGTVPTVNTGNAIYASFVNGETSSVLGAGFSCSPGVTSSSPVGTYSSICSGAVDSNYNISYVPGTVTVNAAPLTITASSGSMTYGGSPFVVGPVPSGFVNGDGLGSLPTPPVCLPVFTTSTPAGTYISTCTGPPVDGNYSVTYVNGSVMVNQATTSTTVTSSLATSNWGNVVTFTATVSPQYSGVPTGDVNFYNAASSASCAYLGTSTLLDQNEPLSATGQATTSNAWLPPGTDNVLACYIGDPNFLMSTGTGSSSTPFAQTVIAAPLATLTPPGGLTFGNQQGGTTSSAQTLTLQNAFNGFNGTAPLLLSIGLTGNNSTWFTESDNCGSSLAAGASCTITLKFAPPLNGTGVASASLNVTDDNENVSGSTQSSSLIGSGLTVITDQSLYTNAIFATAATCGSITLSGGSTVDSFNSAQGYPASDAKAGNVGTNGNLTLNGSKSAVDGTAYLPSTVTGNCSQSSVTGLTTSGGAQVTGGEKQLSGPITYPAPPAPSPAPPTTTQNISGSCPSSISSGLCSNGPGSKAVTLTPGTYGNVTASGGTTVYVSKGTYNTNSLTLSGKSTLYANSGPVVVNLAGASLSVAAQVLDLSGGSIQNPTAIPANLQFTYAGSRGVNLSGGSGSYATVYAPNALVSITGGSDFFGSIIGSTITASGGTAIHYDSNLPNIPAGDYLWFNAVVNNVNLNKTTSQVKLYMTNASVQYTASGTSCTMATPCTSSVPNAVVTFNSSALKSGATTIYDMTNNRWATAVSSSGLTGNTFLAGVAVPVPMGGFPNGIQNVQFSAAFSTDTPGVSLQWQWGAAVYSSFSTTYATSSNKNVLGVNPEDGSANSNPPDPAGTPETYKQYINFGGTGGGLASYTGYLSTKAGLIPTIAPISVSPSSLDFSNGGTVLQTVGTQSSPMTATLTNNDSVAYTINTNGISIGGTNATDFSQTNNCPVGGSFAAGASCNINVTFTPTATGARTAKVVINDLAANSPQTVYLSGTGQ